MLSLSQFSAALESLFLHKSEKVFDSEKGRTIRKVSNIVTKLLDAREVQRTLCRGVWIIYNMYKKC